MARMPRKYSRVQIATSSSTGKSTMLNVGTSQPVIFYAKQNTELCSLAVEAIVALAH